MRAGILDNEHDHDVIVAGTVNIDNDNDSNSISDGDGDGDRNSDSDSNSNIHSGSDSNSDSDSHSDTGACERNTPPENTTPWNISFQSTKSGAGLQFLQLGRMAKAQAKGVFFHRHRYDIWYDVWIHSPKHLYEGWVERGGRLPALHLMYFLIHVFSY